MKPMHDADENQRLGDVESRKAAKQPDATAKDSLRKARDHEASAHARAWRDSNLRAPD